jgi:sulfur carrier protein
MTVQLSHPDRRVEIKGPKRVRELLRDLNLIPEAHLVIRGDDLVTEDEWLKDDDAVEVRPVISGGSSSDVHNSTGLPHSITLPVSND